MGTPMNQVIRRFLTPNLAPKKLFTSPKSPLSCNKSHVRAQKNLNIRKINFQFSPLKNELGVPDFIGVKQFSNNEYTENFEKNSIFGIKKSPISKNIENLEVDTPKRGEILNFGLGDRKMAVLGKGKFGTVVLATYKGQKIVIKILKTEKFQYENELNALNLKHKNIIDTFKIIFEPDKIFGLIFMEFLPGAQNLHEILQNEYILVPKKQILKWALNILDGIKFLHENQILHLDIKPKNILIGKDEILKICDFGNSWKITEKSRTENLGTVYYTAPEIFQGQIPGPESDIYSLGITFWEMENRKIPYEDIECHEIIIYEVVKNNLRPKISKYQSDFTKIYVPCWSQKPKDRPCISDLQSRITKILF